MKCYNYTSIVRWLQTKLETQLETLHSKTRLLQFVNEALKGLKCYICYVKRSATTIVAESHEQPLFIDVMLIFVCLVTRV